MALHSRFLACGMIMVLFGVSSVWSETIRVPADKPTIQSAIDAAINGDTIVVSPGTYFENISFRGKRVVLTSRYYESADTLYILTTILNGSQPASADTGSVVRITNGEDGTAVLQGFTITGGSGTNWRDEHGAGVYREGGGVLIAGSSPTIQFNAIVRNAVTKNSAVTSAGGGGIRAGDGNPSILNNVIAENTGRYGAGVVLNYTGVTMRNNVLRDNSGGQDYGGGALWINQNGPATKLVENTTIANNSVVAVYVYQGSATFHNDILWGGSSASGAQLVARSGVQTASYCDVQGGFSGAGNIASDPQFADSYFHLSTVSPCADAGDTSAQTRDRENSGSPGSALWPSMGGTRDDMGAYGGPGARVLPASSPTTSVPPVKSDLPRFMRLEQNYPNPFNPSTIIRYMIAGDRGQGSGFSNVRLVVYDLVGKEVATLVSETQAPGSYEVRFDGAKVASGVYYYCLTDGGNVETRSMLLLR